MTTFSIAISMTLSVLYTQPANTTTVEPTLSEACQDLPIEDACDVISEASAMLAPMYLPNKIDSLSAFRDMGYDATYIAAKGGGFLGLFRSTTDVFLVSSRQTNRLFIVLPGSESKRDWYENGKFGAYTAKPVDGQFYIPPAHGGFRRGMLNIINSNVLKLNEFDHEPLDCENDDTPKSRLSEHICRYGVKTRAGQIDTVLVGHSRGAGIALTMATAFAGLEFKEGDDGLSIGPQKKWPLDLKAVVAFAPPYAIYRKTDAEIGVEGSESLPSHWDIMRNHGILSRTIMFLNERDVVPLLSLGHGRHFGHYFRVERDGSIEYEGMDWGDDESAIDAHSYVRYCSDILIALAKDTTACERPGGN